MAFQQNYLSVGYTNTANLRCVVWGYTVGTGPIMVLKVGTRASAFFHNPGASLAVCIFQALSGMGAPQNLAFGAGGTFLINPGVALEINPCGSGAWYAVAQSAGAALTVAEF